MRIVDLTFVARVFALMCSRPIVENLFLLTLKYCSNDCVIIGPVVCVIVLTHGPLVEVPSKLSMVIAMEVSQTEDLVLGLERYLSRSKYFVLYDNALMYYLFSTQK